MPSFVALDLETANSHRSSICAVGLAVVRGGEIVDTWSRFVRPNPSYFQSRNVSIHGIDDGKVADAPEFPAVWEELRAFLDGQSIAAYNASFDMSALGAALDAHSLPAHECRGSCVLRLARKAWPSLAGYSLSKVAGHLGLDHTHHDALSDAEVCARVALHGMNELGIAELPRWPSSAA